MPPPFNEVELSKNVVNVNASRVLVCTPDAGNAGAVHHRASWLIARRRNIATLQHSLFRRMISTILDHYVLSDLPRGGCPLTAHGRSRLKADDSRRRGFSRMTTCLEAFCASRSLSADRYPGKSCAWCAEWHRVIGPNYDKTAEGKRATLRRVDLHGERPGDLKAVKPVVYTPTFVLVEQGVELGPIEGYPGEDFFWGLLSQQLAKIPDQTTN